MRAPRCCLALIAFALASASCTAVGGSGDPLRAIDAAELRYLEARDLADALDIAEARGVGADEGGRPVADLESAYRKSLKSARRSLARLRPSTAEDRAAVERMRAALEHEVRAPAEPGAAAPSGKKAASCDARQLVETPGAAAAISEALYACYGERAMRIEVGGETIDRLTVFARLGQESDPARRRELFHAFLPLWKAVDGDPDSGPHPYRELVRRSAADWREKGSPVERQLRSLGLDPAAFERGLEAILEAWRESFAREPIEPWDLHWQNGRAARELAAAVSRERLEEIHRRFYSDLGADPVALGVRYDLAPREGKTPVAFCTFGRRGRAVNGGWSPTVPWVFATYRTGGFDNLVELLHETGHAVHLAGIRTRPAWLDWPDLDAFTEGIADLYAMEAYEPKWQERYLGRSVALADSLRSKYGSIVMDIAWALFEIRMHREPERRPNEVWTELMARYMGIRPHPELSWWALRGQLFSNPGYMSNYAIGAVLVADLRAEARRQRGPFSTPDPGWYDWMAERLYRTGREVESKVLVERFLGRPISTEALLADLERAGTASAAAQRRLVSSTSAK